MNGRQYLKNQLSVILINLLGMLALALFLIASGNPVQTTLFILAVWMLVVALCLLLFYFSRKKYLNQLLDMTEQLEERYLVPEIMQTPERADDQVFYQKLICENNRCSFTRDLMAELENINRFTEQALYYARSEHTEKDYSVREIGLSNVVHGAIADNKYLLRQNNVTVTVDDMEYSIYSDDKWVRFILDQLISNAIKYRTDQPMLHFFAVKENDKIILSVEDNGIGIPRSDLSRIFEKGFTGQNGRTIHSSTGIGLYLCKRLCDKLGIGISASSDGKGTTISLSFHINDFVTGVQG